MKDTKITNLLDYKRSKSDTKLICFHCHYPMERKIVTDFENGVKNTYIVCNMCGFVYESQKKET